MEPRGEPSPEFCIKHGPSGWYAETGFMGKENNVPIIKLTDPAEA